MIFDSYLAQINLSGISTLVLFLDVMILLIIAEIYSRVPRMKKGREILYPVIIVLLIFVIISFIKRLL